MSLSAALTLAAATASGAPDAADADIARRRDQLTFHQAMGLTTLGAMALTGGVGSYLSWQRDARASASVTNPLATAHLALAAGTGIAYLSAATLALTAPPRPFESPYEGVDSILVHRSLALLHGTGVAATIGLGLLAARSDLSWRPYHEWLGLATFGILGASAAAILLDF